MKQLISPSNISFVASSKTITFSTTVPVTLAHILHVTNVTRGVLYFQPQAGFNYSGNYNTPVLTLNCSTAGHSDNDILEIFYDDNLTLDGVDATNSTTILLGGAGIRGYLSSIWTKLNGTIGVTGTFWQANQPVSVSNFPTTQSISGVVTVSGSSTNGQATMVNSKPVVLASDQSALPISGNVSISNLPSTQAISAITLPLPSGASTIAAQTAGNTSLSSIDSKIATVNTGNVTIGNALPSGTNTIGKVGIDPANNGVVANPPVVSGISGSLAATASGTIVSADLRAYSAAIVTITGTWTGTLVAQSSGGDVAFGSTVNLSFMNQVSVANTGQGSTTANGQFIIPGGGYTRIQLAVPGTGTVNVNMQPMLASPWINTVGVAAAQSGTWTVVPVPSTGLGPNGSHTTISTAGNTPTLIANGPRVLSALLITNTSSTWKYLKFYNNGTAPTVGTTVPVFNIGVPPNSTINWPLTFGYRVTNGLAFAFTGGSAFQDTTAIAAGEMIVNAVY